MSLTPDRWAIVERLYHAALERPDRDRAAFVAAACAGDRELRREVESVVFHDSADVLRRADDVRSTR